MYVASPNQKNNNKRNRKKDPTTSIKNLYIKNTGVVRIVDRWIDFTTQKFFIHLK